MCYEIDELYTWGFKKVNSSVLPRRELGSGPVSQRRGQWDVSEALNLGPRTSTGSNLNSDSERTGKVVTVLRYLTPLKPSLFCDFPRSFVNVFAESDSLNASILQWVRFLLKSVLRPLVLALKPRYTLRDDPTLQNLVATLSVYSRCLQHTLISNLRASGIKPFMKMARIFLIGASGYLGGDTLYRLKHSPLSGTKIACLVRDTKKGDKILEEYPDVEIIKGDLDDADLIAQEAARADVVLRRST